MNKTAAFLLIVIAAISLVFLTQSPSKAVGKNFASVVPFVTVGDRLGFFDQSNGKIYLYDNNISQCVFKGQIQDLGQPIQTINSKDEVPVNRGVL